MSRVNRSSIQKHKKVLKMAKGYWGRAGTCYRIAKRVVEKGLQYAYRDRRNKKRDFRALWIQRINAAARSYGMNYSVFIHQLKENNIELDRKTLAYLALHEGSTFESLVAAVRQ